MAVFGCTLGHSQILNLKFQGDNNVRSILSQKFQFKLVTHPYPRTNHRDAYEETALEAPVPSLRPSNESGGLKYLCKNNSFQSLFLLGLGLKAT